MTSEYKENECNTINNANKYVEITSKQHCISLINNLISDCDTYAMRMWKTDEDFSQEEIGRIIQLKEMRTYLCKIEKELNNGLRWLSLSDEENNAVMKYINDYKQSMEE